MTTLNSTRPAEPRAGGRHRAPDPSAKRTIGGSKWLILGVIALAQLVVVLDATIVNIALPSAQLDLGFSDDARQWLITGYALAFGSLLLVGGRLGDLVGRKPMFLVGLIGFASASVLGGVAGGIEVLIAARALQGVFGAMLAPAALSLLTVTFTEKDERAKAFGVFGAISGGGGAIGLILGGALTEYLSWRWCLYVNAPLALIAVIGTVILIPALGRSETRARLDLPGSLVIVGGLVALVYGLGNAEAQGWTSTVTLTCIALGVSLIGIFLLIERDVANPLLPLRILADRTRGGAYVALLVCGAGMFAVLLFLTFYLSTVKQFTPLQTGFAFLPMIAALAVSATALAKVTATVGPKLSVFTGMLLAAVGLLLFTQLGFDSSYVTHVVPGLVITGLGLGLVMAPAMAAATSGVQADDAGVASAAVSTFQQIGGSIGTAVLSALAAAAASDYLQGRVPNPATQAMAAMESYTTTFFWGAVIFAAGALVCGLLFPPGPIESDTAVTPVPAH
ncbi:MFS transporter [Mycolicibacterium diernhoferi]|uniref:MFS transporter n=3 Tax=Mycolicibacterium diernhoferi TaxID=1801 RepID=A0A1Q4HJN8_9MYCO|nr:MFS transporter [Mycolicibacterium diernhoferi]OJZ67756.1 MFS transporter [Mycolicibacterium diernhoferi]PEG51671.1 MFS transporter [Mycolicibacterium diernhoferi]QYL20404.1 MFS transporter [Mycolicibacterium diernhoferi]